MGGGGGALRRNTCHFLPHIPDVTTYRYETSSANGNEQDASLSPPVGLPWLLRFQSSSALVGRFMWVGSLKSGGSGRSVALLCTHAHCPRLQADRAGTGSKEHSHQRGPVPWIL